MAIGERDRSDVRSNANAVRRGARACPAASAALPIETIGRGGRRRYDACMLSSPAVPRTPNAASVGYRRASEDQSLPSEKNGGFVEALYRKHKPDLVEWLRHRYGEGPPSPEETAQTAFARIAALDRHDHIRHPKSFLYRVAVNAALDSVGWLKRTRAFVDDELYRKGSAIDASDPESVLLSKERMGVLVASVEALTSKQREVVMRSRFRAQTCAQIAAETGWSKSDVFRQLQAALRLLKESLDVYDATEPRIEQVNQL